MRVLVVLVAAVTQFGCASSEPMTAAQLQADLRSACTSTIEEFRRVGIDASTGTSVTGARVERYLTVVGDKIAGITDPDEVSADLGRGELYVANNLKTESLVAKAVMEEEKVSNCLRRRRLEQLGTSD